MILSLVEIGSALARESKHGLTVMRVAAESRLCAALGLEGFPERLGYARPQPLLGDRQGLRGARGERLGDGHRARGQRPVPNDLGGKTEPSRLFGINCLAEQGE